MSDKKIKPGKRGTPSAPPASSAPSTKKSAARRPRASPTVARAGASSAARAATHPAGAKASRPPIARGPSETGPVALAPELVPDDDALFEEPGIALDDDEAIPLHDPNEALEDATGAAAPSSFLSAESEPTLLPGGGALVRLDPLGRYLSEIRRYPALEREEEIRLARRVREAHDPEAAQRLVTSNLVLVVKIARLFRRAVANVLDLIQEGNVGLLHALERFDPDVGVKFSTYASWWIRAYILKYLLDNTRLVRVGTTNARRKLLYNLNREKRRLEAAGFTAGPRLLAEKFGVSERDVVDIEQSLRGPDVALDAPIGEDGTMTRGDMLASEDPTVEDQVARQELKELLDAKLAVFRARLAEKEAAILDARLLADTPATLQEIGDRFGITREAVRQAEKRLTDRLREYLTEELGEEAVLQFRKR